MSKETPESQPDLSAYGQYFTRPQEARAKRLVREKNYKISVNGVETEVTGHKGDWDVYILKKNGQVLRNEPYTQEIFEDKFGQKDTQGNLVFKTEEREDGR